MTYLFLAGGSIGTMWKNSQRINPKTGKTFIKLDLILLTLPCQLSGALFGVIHIITIGCIPQLLLIDNDHIPVHLPIPVPNLRPMQSPKTKKVTPQRNKRRRVHRIIRNE